MNKVLLPVAILITLFCYNSFAQNKKVAVVTFYVVKQIGLAEFGSAAAIASVTKLSDDPNFNMLPMLKSFHNQFFDDYAKTFPFQLLPEEQVINNDAYKAFIPAGGGGTGVLKDNYNVPYEGYKVILQTLGHDNEKSLVNIFNQCDGVMTVFITFDLVKIGFGGMGVVKVNAHANMVLFNKNGEKVFVIREDAKSSNASPLIGGVPVMTAEKILPMCESALNELMANLQKAMPKIVKKADAKL